MSEHETHPETTVKVEGNDVFFYCDVNDETVTELHVALKKLEKDLFTRVWDLDIVPKIRIHIRSDGGDLYAGLSSLDFIKNMKAYIVTIVEGCCASAATFLFLGGKTRIVCRNAYILIHQLSSDVWGTYEDIKDEMHQCKTLMKHMKRIYLRETKIPERKLLKLMKRDVYLSYKKCIRYGISND